MQGKRTEPAPPESACAVVLNWNLPELTMRCVRALVDDGFAAERVVVVDNGSTDGSVALLERQLDGPRLLVLPQNVGYARASNAGARELDATAYLLVNNDAFVHRPGSVARLLAALERNAIGIAVPRLVNEDLTLQPSVVPISTPANAFVRATGLSRLVPNRWQPAWSTHWDHGSSREIVAANGAVMAVRAEVWHALGGYTERSHMFSEDLDLCWRARRLGWKTWFECEAEFVHLGNATGQNRFSSGGRAELVSRSDAAMIRAQLGRVRAAATISFLSLGLLARAVAFRLLGRPEAARWALASFRGYVRRKPIAEQSSRS